MKLYSHNAHIKMQNIENNATNLISYTKNMRLYACKKFPNFILVNDKYVYITNKILKKILKRLLKEKNQINFNLDEKINKYQDRLRLINLVFHDTMQNLHWTRQIENLKILRDLLLIHSSLTVLHAYSSTKLKKRKISYLIHLYIIHSSISAELAKYY